MTEKRVPEYAFSKVKLPRGMSFPLKRSVLDAALTEARVQRVIAVSYDNQLRHGQQVIRASFTGETRRGWHAAGACTIHVYSVPSGHRKAVEEALTSAILPRLMAWVVELERAGNTRRATEQEFVANWGNGVVSITAS